MTRARKQVLEGVGASGVPCTAGQLAQQLSTVCDQATVYRALHWLEGQGLVGSFIFHCADHGTERYYVATGLAHRHWFHCEQCHRFFDLGACTLESAIALWQKTLGIEVRSHNLQLSGLCSRCRQPDAGEVIPVHPGVPGCM